MPEVRPGQLRVFAEVRNLVGESPVWSAAEKALYWVDVEGRLAQRLGSQGGNPTRWCVPEPIGCIGLRKAGGLVCAIRSGFTLFDPESGRMEPIADPETDRPDNRFNDGKVDRRGRFWAGTRNFRDHSKKDGSLYRLDANRSIHQIDSGFTCPNGIAWSPDDKRMYVCDTWIRAIFVYDFDADAGLASNKRVFATLTPEEGYPDGLTVDADGFLWNAHYDGWRITRYAPNRRVDRVIKMPVRHVTSLTFGGERVQTLFITTGCLRLSDDERASQPSAGHVFALEPSAQGIAEPMFAG